MINIIPAILEKELSEIQSKMKRVKNIVDIVQVDICDGDFVPTMTYAHKGNTRSVKAVVSSARKNKLQLEFDMMVNFDCTGCMTRWAQVLAENRPEKVVFHLGSTYRWSELFSRIQQSSKNKKIPFTCGLAVRIDHTRNEIRKVLEAHGEFQYIQIMGIEKVGHSGQKLSPKIYDRIVKLRRAFPDMCIQIDGGVKKDNAMRLIEAGANNLGMNSGVYKTKNIKETIDEIQAHQ